MRAATSLEVTARHGSCTDQVLQVAELFIANDDPNAKRTIQKVVDADGRNTLLVSIVTAPVRARTRPDTLVPIPRVMLDSATMLPLKAAPPASVAELPTCQNTFAS